MRFFILFIVTILTKSVVSIDSNDFERSLNGLDELRETLGRQNVSPQTRKLIDMIFKDLSQLSEESNNQIEQEKTRKTTEKAYEMVTEISPTTGTTPNFKDIYLGRCHYFVNVLHADTCFLQPYLAKKINCTRLIEEFLKVIVGKTPCEVTVDDFSKYLSLASHPIPVNRSLFYTDSVYEPAHQISRVRDFWTLEDTLTGYLNNELVACSKNSCDALAEVCSDACVLKNNSFWIAASRSFAKAAEGVVSVVLNGTDPRGAFCNDTMFAVNQLPEISPEKVSTLKVFLIHQPGQRVVETCGYPKSLNALKDSVVTRGILYECCDDPEEIRLLLCFENPDSYECSRLRQVKRVILTKSPLKV